MKQILVTTDFSEDAAKAFPVAKDLCLGDATVTLLHVASAPEGVYSGELGLPPEQYESIMASVAKNADSRLAEIAKQQFADHNVDRIVARATKPAYEEVVDVATQKKASYIVMASHGRTGFQRFLLGGVTEKVLRLAPCPVVVVPVK